MRRILSVTVVVAMMAISSAAFAQDDEGDTKSKFYDFDDMLVDGQLKTPDVQRMDARGEAKFKRLLSLKKSFLKKVQESTEESALK